MSSVEKQLEADIFWVKYDKVYTVTGTYQKK